MKYRKTCKRCGHKWKPRKPKPKQCPKCQSDKWNEVGLDTGDRRLAGDARKTGSTPGQDGSIPSPAIELKVSKFVPTLVFPPPTPVRHAVIAIPARLLIEMCRHNDQVWQRCVKNPLPHDCHIVEGHFDAKTESFMLTLWSSQFAEVPSNEPLPVLEPRVGIAYR